MARITEGRREIPWINTLKALCILFVYFRHCESYCNFKLGWFDSLFLPFYVNAFFFVSGYLLFWKQLSPPLINESCAEYYHNGGKITSNNILFRIAIPSILFSILEFFPKMVVVGQGFNYRVFLLETFGGCTFWFTSAILVAELLFLLFLMTRIKNIWFYTLIAILFAYFGRYLAASDFRFIDSTGAFPWQFRNGFICMAYMAMGGLYWKYEHLIRKHMKKGLVLLLVVVYCLGSILFRPYLYHGYMTSMEYFHLWGALWSGFASVLLVEICRIIPRVEILSFIGRKSIGFYFLSGALPVIISSFAFRFYSSPSVLMLLGVWAICSLLAVLFIKILTCYLPFLFDLRVLINKTSNNV